MIFSAQDGYRGTVINAETNQPVRWVRWVNSDTGEFEAFREDPLAARARGVFLRGLLYRGKAKLPLTTVTQALVAHAPGRRALTPWEEFREIRSIARDYVRDYKPIVAVPGIECDEPGCRRLASWQVGHEQEIDPGVLQDGSECERAVTVRVNRWCSRHWHPPTFRSTCGVENEVEVACRPQ
jgi:hypothetical protein